MFNKFLEQNQICNYLSSPIFWTPSFSNVGSFSSMKTDIAKYHISHLIYSFVYLYESWHWINSGCVGLTQAGSTLNANHCTFTSNNAEDDAGAIFAWVGHGIQGLSILENRIHFWVVTQFCTKSPWNCCSFSNGPSPHSFSIPTFGLEKIQYVQNWFWKPSTNDVMMWLWQFPT